MTGTTNVAASVKQRLLTLSRRDGIDNQLLLNRYVVEQDMVDTNFKLYKRVTDDPEFAKYFLNWLFERFRRGLGDSPTPHPPVG